MGTERHSGLTLAPEVARDDMREQIRKKIKNEDLYEGCRKAFANGFDHVKLYFLCGLPGERPVDLDGIVEMAETIARIGREVRGRFPEGHGERVELRAQGPHAVSVERHADARVFSLGARVHEAAGEDQERARELPPGGDEPAGGLLSRGDRRVADVVELAWRRGRGWIAGWSTSGPSCGGRRARSAASTSRQAIHEPCAIGDRLPWDHINVKKGRTFLEKEQQRATVQLAAMAEAK